MFELPTSMGDGEKRGGVIDDKAKRKHVFISGLQVLLKAFADLLELATSI